LGSTITKLFRKEDKLTSSVVPPTPQKDMFNEVSVNRRYFSIPTPERMMNSDELVGRKGLRIYGEMGTDDAVKAAMAMKKHAVLSTGWDIEPATPDKQDMEVAEFVRWNFEKMDGSLDTNLQEILSSLTFGFSLSELIWRKLELGPYISKIGLKAIKTRLPHGFVFVVDWGQIYTASHASAPPWHLPRPS